MMFVIEYERRGRKGIAPVRVRAATCEDARRKFMRDREGWVHQPTILTITAS